VGRGREGEKEGEGGKEREVLKKRERLRERGPFCLTGYKLSCLLSHLGVINIFGSYNSFVIPKFNKIEKGNTLT
jgi:hypothetical protein